MSPLVTAYATLGIAILLEVGGTTLLQRSEQFTRLWPTLGLIVCYMGAFYLLTQAIRTIPLGTAYAIWGGLGIVLTAIISVAVFRQRLDAPALIGIGLIVCGVLVTQLFSRTLTH